MHAATEEALEAVRGARYKASSLVLGCGRLGSVLTPLGRRQCVDLLHLAFDLGVRDFDTANIYGQGDSERFIGEAFRGHRNEVRLASKAGQQLSPKQRALSLFKGPARFLASRKKGIRAEVQRQRTTAMRFDFDAASISRSLEQSLRRLRTDHLDIFYLHSPPVGVLLDEDLQRRLEQHKREGKFARLGVSCDDAELLAAASRWGPADVLQFDVGDSPVDAPALASAMAQGKSLMLRGTVRHGEPATGSEHELMRLLKREHIAGVVVGTTQPQHLRANVALVQRLHAASRREGIDA